MKVLLDFSEESLPDIESLYAEYNREYFDNELPSIEVVWSKRLATTAGRAHYKFRGGKRVATKIDLSYKLFKAHDFDKEKLKQTMLHEMVHVWMYQEHNESGHGPKFQRKMDEIVGERESHTYHSYDVTSVKKKRRTKIDCYCENCGHIGYRLRLPKGAKKGRKFQHPLCGGIVTFKRVPYESGRKIIKAFDKED